MLLLKVFIIWVLLFGILISLFLGTKGVILNLAAIWAIAFFTFFELISINSALMASLFSLLAITASEIIPPMVNKRVGVKCFSPFDYLMTIGITSLTLGMFFGPLWGFLASGFTTNIGLGNAVKKYGSMIIPSFLSGSGIRYWCVLIINIMLQWVVLIS
ncbi:MAG: hypothetical protein GX318_00055 [Clostridia bacterium]|nr:hypothetical protein [Clostridia bacterium]